MRVTGEMPHLGTFLGWIHPVSQLSTRFDVIVLIADLQSIDLNHSFPDIREQSLRLRDTLQKLLPSKIIVILESEIPEMLPLAFQLMPFFRSRDFKRLAPFRKKLRLTGKIENSMLLYPALMLANVIAFNSTNVLAKPEGRFQHFDVLNDVMGRVNMYLNAPKRVIQTTEKPLVNIWSLDGSGPMKRDRSSHGLLEILPITKDHYTQQLNAAVVPNVNPSIRFEHCKPIRSIWASIAPNGSWAPKCLDLAWDCESCKRALASVLVRQVKEGHGQREVQRVSSNKAHEILIASERCRSITNRLRGHEHPTEDITFDNG